VTTLNDLALAGGLKTTPVRFSTWALKVIASIGNLSGTPQDRSIVIRLHRKLRLTLQTQFAQDQMKAFTTQTQELYKLIGETAQKSGCG
jgi:hypothetical protein